VARTAGTDRNEEITSLLLCVLVFSIILVFPCLIGILKCFIITLHNDWFDWFDVY